MDGPVRGRSQQVDKRARMWGCNHNGDYLEGTRFLHWVAGWLILDAREAASSFSSPSAPAAWRFSDCSIRSLLLLGVVRQALLVQWVLRRPTPLYATQSSNPTRQQCEYQPSTLAHNQPSRHSTHHLTEPLLVLRELEPWEVELELRQRVFFKRLVRCFRSAFWVLLCVLVAR